MWPKLSIGDKVDILAANHRRARGVIVVDMDERGDLLVAERGVRGPRRPRIFERQEIRAVFPVVQS